MIMLCPLLLQNLCVAAAYRPIREILEKEKKVISPIMPLFTSQDSLHINFDIL